MQMQLSANKSRGLAEFVQLERRAFAAKLRIARAILGWSQTEFARHVGITQRAIHKLEQGETEPRRATVHAIEEIWFTEGIEFEDEAGGFRLAVHGTVLDRAKRTKSRGLAKIDLGATARAAFRA